MLIKYDKIISIILRDIDTVEEKYSLNDGDLHNTAVLNGIIDVYKTQLKNPINISKINKSIKTWIEDVLLLTFNIKKIFDIGDITKQLKKLKVPALKNILQHLGITGNIKSRNDIIAEIFNHKFLNDEINFIAKTLSLTKKYYKLQDTEQFITIMTNLEQLSSLWTKYLG